ncbi:MAG: NUDIX hydrolase [Patescibacteria group bacterium]|nr:NUDIX hydrolase [Patescibacteria group bacterium]
MPNQESLKDVPTGDLARELGSRPDLFLGGGRLLVHPVFKLREQLGPISCVDGVPARVHAGRVELMVIRRGTGPCASKLALVGGVIGMGESVEGALRRHFSSDLGVKIDLLTPIESPSVVAQYSREPREGFLPEPGRDHCIGLTFLVALLDDSFVFGETEHGGQEVVGVHWFAETDMPVWSEFGYGQDSVCRSIFPIARRLLLGRR